MRQRKNIFRNKFILRFFAILVGLALDWRYKELPEKLHPLVVFGKLMTWSEKKIYKKSKSSGFIYLCLGIAASLAVSCSLRMLAHLLFVNKSFSDDDSALREFVVLAVGAYFAIGGATLWHIATIIAELLEAGDLDAARYELSKLVSRDTGDLDVHGIVRATVESVAENTVDAVISPICYADMGGVTPVLVHRAVNTMDAMVGYKNEVYAQFGFFSAKCDDVLNYIPARLAALATMLAIPRRSFFIYSSIKNQAGAHPSPNGGVIETAFATALGIQLGGINFYNSIPESRPVLGFGRVPEVSDIREAVILSKKITLVSTVLVSFFMVLLDFLLTTFSHQRTERNEWA